MSCPTCGKTMQYLGETDRRIYHCATCGTVRMQGTHYDDFHVPQLVERCRMFEAQELFAPDWTTTKAWHTLGIAEAINPPGRPAA